MSRCKQLTLDGHSKKYRLGLSLRYGATKMNKTILKDKQNTKQTNSETGGEHEQPWK